MAESKKSEIMCGRYYVDDETAREIERLVRQVDEKMKAKAGDIHPTERATVIQAEQRFLAASQMDWGFPGINGKGVIINARCESIKEKKMFSDSTMNRRCVIPARGFYEWNKKKEKVTFQAPDEKVIYLAGIWKHFDEQSRFVILTTAANESMIEVHDRMPLILNRVEDWVLDDKCVDFMLHKTPMELKKSYEYEQCDIFHLK